MPSSSDELRNKFGFGNGEDGIEMAESIIIKNGGSIDPDGVILTKNVDLDHDPELHDLFWDAVQFLIEEWDYCLF